MTSSLLSVCGHISEEAHGDNICHPAHTTPCPPQPLPATNAWIHPYWYTLSQWLIIYKWALTSVTTFCQWVEDSSSYFYSFVQKSANGVLFGWEKVAYFNCATYSTSTVAGFSNYILIVFNKCGNHERLHQKNTRTELESCNIFTCAVFPVRFCVSLQQKELLIRRQFHDTVKIQEKQYKALKAHILQNTPKNQQKTVIKKLKDEQVQSACCNPVICSLVMNISRAMWHDQYFDWVYFSKLAISRNVISDGMSVGVMFS